MPLFTSVLAEVNGRYEFRADEWDRAADEHEPVGICAEDGCRALVYARRAYTPDYSGAVYREFECSSGHQQCAAGRFYRTRPIVNPLVRALDDRTMRELDR